MGVITIVLYALVVVIAVLLIGLILIQQSKGGGFGGVFGGVGESVFGAHASGHLTKLTVILVSIFFAVTLSLAIITGHREKEKSIIEKIPVQKEETAAAQKQAAAGEPSANAAAPSVPAAGSK